MKRFFACLLVLTLLLSLAPLSAFAGDAPAVEDVPVMETAPAAPMETAPAEPLSAALLAEEHSSLALRFFVNGTENYYKNLVKVSVTSSNGKLTDYGDSFEVEDGAELTVLVGSFGEAYRLDRLELGMYGGTGEVIENGEAINFAEPDYPKNSMYYLAVYLTTNEGNGYYAVHRGESARGSMAIQNSAGTTIGAQKTDRMINRAAVPMAMPAALMAEMIPIARRDFRAKKYRLAISSGTFIGGRGEDSRSRQG